MELVPEGVDVELKPLHEYPRAEELNPLNLTPQQKAQYVEWESQLIATYPHIKKDFLRLALDYYFVKGGEECEKEMQSGKFCVEQKKKGGT